MHMGGTLSIMSLYQIRAKIHFKYASVCVCERYTQLNVLFSSYNKKYYTPPEQVL